VYDKVQVTLKNEEFNDISQKELEAAQYLERLHRIKLAKDVDSVE